MPLFLLALTRVPTRVLRALTAASVPVAPPAPRTETSTQPHPPYVQSPLRLNPRNYPHPHPHPLDPERRTRRTAMRLALDGIVVVAGVSQVCSVGRLVLVTTGAAA
ncbi:hypothetical protein [Streptomyces sp. NBC_01766]|uniref:hypothetical protein n=1 Tax=Streptomyces sp. NBC_01766 TaxID=2975936 RepID=UPI002DDC27BD|nr:hypothetical protein [Streptomyces sp. NBC_01766]WSC21390.1 hypothetical protein OIE60_17825 [Streptomyces sp. NBC_01766]